MKNEDYQQMKENWKQIISYGPRPFGSASLKQCSYYLTKEMKKLGCKVYLPQTSFSYFGAHMDPQKLKAQRRNILIGAFDFSHVSIGSQVQNAAFLSCLKEI